MAGTLSPRSYAQLHLDGHSDAEIAELCSCTASYVSQIAAQDSTKQMVTDMRATMLQSEAASQLDGKYDTLELSLLQKLEKSVNFLSKPMEISRVLQTINAAKRRRGPLSAGATGNAPIVQLVVPVTLHTKVVLSEANEVLEVGGRRMSTMPAANLNNLLEKRNEQARIGAADSSTGNHIIDAIG